MNFGIEQRQRVSKPGRQGESMETLTAELLRTQNSSSCIKAILALVQRPIVLKVKSISFIMALLYLCLFLLSSW